MLPVPTVENIDRDILAGFQAIREGERELPYPVFTEVRASSMPICPRAIHISRRLPRKKRPTRVEKFVQESTTLMGTALHLVLQKWFAIMFPDSFYGNWECLFCKTFKKHRTGVQICPSCGREMTYKEYAIHRQKGIPFSGHIDGILRFPGINYLLDYKGSYQEKMRNIKIERRPVRSHFYQTNSYACAVNTGKVPVGKLGKIDKIIIIYIERGKPHRLWYPMQVSVDKRAYKQTKQYIRLGNRSLKERIIPRGFCMGPKDEIGRWCSWNPLCFSPTLEDRLSDKIYPEKKFKPKSDNLLPLLLSAENARNQS